MSNPRSFAQICADQNKLAQLKTQLKQCEANHAKIAQKATEAGYPVVKNIKAEQIKDCIKLLENALA